VDIPGTPIVLRLGVRRFDQGGEMRGIPSGARLRPVLALACVSALAALSPCPAGSLPTYNVVKSIPLKSQFATRSDWIITAYQAQSSANSDSIGDDPAKLCFSRASDKRQDCTKITSGITNDPGFTYNYQTVKRLDIVPLKPSLQAVFFHAEFSAGGSGTADQFSLWTYDRKSDSFWPTLMFTTNESGGMKVISNGPLAGYVITADAAWQIDKGEFHFSAHHYNITVYRLSGQFYLKVLNYLTTRKYGGDDVAPDIAIACEMPRIPALLKAVGQ